MRDSKRHGSIREVNASEPAGPHSRPALHDVTPVGIFKTDTAGNCVWVNKRWSELTGLTPKEALGDGWARALHPLDREAILEAWRATATRGLPFHMEYRFVRPDGASSWVIGEAYEECDASGAHTGYVGTVTDITALKHAEEALRREKELNENIVGSSVDGILAFDRQCRYTVWNHAMEQISGVSASETLGKCAFDVFPFLKEIGEDWYFHEALAGRYAVARDRRYTIPSTGHSGFFEGRYTPLRDAEGTVIGGLGIIRDITDLKQTQAALLQAGKLAAMGELGAGVAHELNQPLTGISILVNMLRDNGDHTIDEFDEELALIAEQLTRMGSIIDNVRGFAREGRFTPSAAPALQPLNRALALTAEQLRLAGVEITEAFEPDLPNIYADAAQLQQVFLNLLSNAFHALQSHPGEKRLHLGARFTGDGVEFTVEDSGPGIPEDVRSRIFEPFFTTKEPGHGTGLGLSLCHGIITEHGGEIRVEAAEPGGTRIVVSVPRTGQPVDPTRPSTLPPPKNKPTARILVVDDEAILRKVVCACLEQLGYAYEAVVDAQSALSRVTDSPFDLALVDLKMPVMDGRSLCTMLRQSHPELALVVMSGFVTEDESSELIELGVRNVITKPFTKSGLARALAGALRSGKHSAGASS